VTSPASGASATELRCDVRVEERRLRLIPRIGRLAAGPGRAGPSRAGRDAASAGRGAAWLGREAVSTCRGVDAPATH